MSRIQIRRTYHHYRPGFLVCGGPSLYAVRIFTASRHRAELIKRALLADITVDERFALTSLILCSPRLGAL